MIRLFVAIWPPDSIVNAVVTAVAGVVTSGTVRADFRAVPAKNLHVTLGFLGEVDDDRVASIVGSLDDIDSPPVELTLDAQPTWFYGGQLVLPVAGADALAAAVDDTLELPRNKPFSGHITVARTKSKTKARLPVAEFDVPRKFVASSFSLVESQLEPDGPRYRTLHEFALG